MKIIKEDVLVLLSIAHLYLLMLIIAAQDMQGWWGKAGALSDSLHTI